LFPPCEVNTFFSRQPLIYMNGQSSFVRYYAILKLCMPIIKFSERITVDEFDVNCLACPFPAKEKNS